MLSGSGQEVFEANGNPCFLLLQMSMKRILTLFAYSVIGGIITALAFAASVDRQLGVQALLLPSVASIATIAGAAVGVLLTPLFIWALRGKKLCMGITSIYASSIVLTSSLNLLQVRFSMYVSIALTVVVLTLYKAIGK
jgi:hypothetical protein